MNRNDFAVLLVALLGLSLFSFGCVQEKQWPASPTPYAAPSVAPSVSANASVAASVAASKTPTPHPTSTPSPSPSPTPTPAPASCLLTANPLTFVSSTDIVAVFKNLPAGTASAVLKCSSSDSGTTVTLSSQGGAFLHCAYDLVGSVTARTLSASAGGVSCETSATQSASILPSPSPSVSPSPSPSPSSTPTPAPVYSFAVTSPADFAIDKTVSNVTTKDFALFNNGTAALGIFTCPPNPASWVTYQSGCPVSLAVGASAMVTYSFDATAQGNGPQVIAVAFSESNAGSQNGGVTVTISGA